MGLETIALLATTALTLGATGAQIHQSQVQQRQATDAARDQQNEQLRLEQKMNQQVANEDAAAEQQAQARRVRAAQSARSSGQQDATLLTGPRGIEGAPQRGPGGSTLLGY